MEADTHSEVDRLLTKAKALRLAAQETDWPQYREMFLKCASEIEAKAAQIDAANRT